MKKKKKTTKKKVEVDYIDDGKYHRPTYIKCKDDSRIIIISHLIDFEILDENLYEVPYNSEIVINKDKGLRMIEIMAEKGMHMKKKRPS